MLTFMEKNRRARGTRVPAAAPYSTRCLRQHDSVGAVLQHPASVRPAIRVTSFGLTDATTASRQCRDKSTSPRSDDQDQHTSVASFSTNAHGVSIKVEPEGLYSSPDYPDGFRWTQTIETNTRRGGSILASPVSYVDPTPNDDSKPFYWTDAEHATHSGVFSDSPSRKPRAGGTVHWDATLSLTGVNGKAVERFDTLGYGFSVDSAGNTSARGPSSPGSIAAHMKALKSAFPGWSFR